MMNLRGTALIPALILALSALAAPVLVTAPARAQGANAPASQIRVTVDIPFQGLAQWVQVRAMLDRLPDGVSATVDAISSGGAVVTFMGRSDRAALVAGVQRAGFLWREANPRPMVTIQTPPAQQPR